MKYTTLQCIITLWLVFFSTCFLLLSHPTTIAANSYPNDFKILSHNVYMLSRNLYPNWGQMIRADLIAEADYIQNQDLVILNEVFDSTSSNHLLNRLSHSYPYQTPVLGRSKNGWDDTQGSYSNLTLEDGGVAIVSKWPLVEKIQYVYKRGCGVDGAANKGFVYVKIEKGERFYHVIATHMQSDDERCATGKAASHRKSQMDEIQQFIQHQNIPTDEIIFIGGDLNVDKSSAEYNTMLATLHVNPPTSYAGFTSTWDPTTNGIAYYNYPQAPAQYLDYILVEKDHAQPQNWHIQSMNIKSPEWTVTSWFKKYTYNDYSDHYPIVGFSTP